MNLPLAAGGARVLLVGTGIYESEEFPNVASVEATLIDLADVLVRNCGLRSENLVILRDPDSISEIGSALTEASEAATEALIVYFVGHGLVHSNGELYLAHARTIARSSHIAFTALRYSNVRECILNSPARAIYVILDCCFAGRAVGTLAPSSVVDQARVDGACVIAATARDELALAPVGDSYTAFSGELIAFLRDGDPELAEYLRVRDAFRHLAIALPARNCPTPTFLANQNADELVLCRNSAFPNGDVSASGTEPSIESEIRADLDLDSPSVTSTAAVGQIVNYRGWVDFNPLPAALTDVDSRVPRNLDQLAELIADRPPNWESRLFAGTALQELVVLRRAFVRHFQGPFTPNGVEKSGQGAFDYIREELDNFGAAIEVLNELLRDDRHTEILESEDRQQIQAHARALTDVIDTFMQISDRLRSTSITNRHLRRAANILAHFSDQPIISATKFIQKYITELDQSGRRIADGRRADISLTLTVEISDVLSEEFGDAMARY